MDKTLAKLERLFDEARAVLFDFDGVIVDSEPFYYLSYNQAFEKRGYSIREEDYWVYWSDKGEGIEGEATRQGIPWSREEIAAVYAERRVNYSAFCRSGKIPFFPRMAEVLARIKERGKPCAIASSAFEDDILAIFEGAGRRRPPCTVVGRRAGLRPKPEADIFVYAAGVLQAAPSECLVFEDAQKGLEAAKAVGMRCAILKNGRNRGLSYPKADCVVEDHEELAAWLLSSKGGPE